MLRPRPQLRGWAGYAEWSGDVLAVHENVEQGLDVGRPDGMAARAGETADPGDDLGFGQERGSLAGGAVDRLVEAESRPQEFGEDFAESSMSEGQVGGYFAHPPPLAQRRRLPLPGCEGFEQIAQTRALLVDRRPDLVDIHGRDTPPSTK